jgi:hypothetical protein
MNVVAEQTNTGTATPHSLNTTPKDSDAGSNSYVVTYLTRKHGSNGSEVSFDYGPNLDVASEDLTKGSFNGVGDNLMWGEVLWRFALEGSPFLLRTSLVSNSRSAGTQQLVKPTSPVHLPDGSVLSPRVLQGFASYPFNENGSLRDAKELGRDSGGEIAFVDVSDKQGQDVKSSEILAHIKSSASVRNLPGANGPEFVAFDNLRYAGPGGNLMRPDGMADMLATRKVKEILAKAPEVPVKHPTDSVFKPINEKSKDSRFAKKMDLEEATTSAKELNSALENTRTIAKELGFSKSARLKAVIAFYGKKSRMF